MPKVQVFDVCPLQDKCSGIVYWVNYTRSISISISASRMNRNNNNKYTNKLSLTSVVRYLFSFSAEDAHGNCHRKRELRSKDDKTRRGGVFNEFVQRANSWAYINLKGAMSVGDNILYPLYSFVEVKKCGPYQMWGQGRKLKLSLSFPVIVTWIAYYDRVAS